MQSMTGHGTASHAVGHATALATLAPPGAIPLAVEIRAVNHRHLDLRVSGAAAVAALCRATPEAVLSVARIEELVAARVRAVAARGAITITLRVEANPDAPGRSIDNARARAVHRELTELATALGIAGPTLETVLAQPGVLTTTAGQDGIPRDVVEAAVVAVVDAALAAFTQVRAREGSALASELTRLATAIEEVLAGIRQSAQDGPTHVRERLLARLAAAGVEHASLDPMRLAQEAALLADRADITEEITRAQVHLQAVGKAIAAQEPIGRRLDFLVQELLREFTTMGAKTAQAEISHLVVDAKSLVEKLREQVQNVE